MSLERLLAWCLEWLASPELRLQVALVGRVPTRMPMFHFCPGVAEVRPRGVVNMQFPILGPDENDAPPPVVVPEASKPHVPALADLSNAQRHKLHAAMTNERSRLKRKV